MRVVSGHKICDFCIKKRTTYWISLCLEFKRVLFRSNSYGLYCCGLSGYGIYSNGLEVNRLHYGLIVTACIAVAYLAMAYIVTASKSTNCIID